MEIICCLQLRKEQVANAKGETAVGKGEKRVGEQREASCKRRDANNNVYTGRRTKLQA